MSSRQADGETQGDRGVDDTTWNLLVVTAMDRADEGRTRGELEPME